MTDDKVDFIKWPSATQKGYMEAHEGDGIVMQRPHAARGTVQSQSSPTLTTQVGGGSGVVVIQEHSNLSSEDVTMNESVPSSSGSTVKKDMSPTLKTHNSTEVVTNENGTLRIRYLTPRECLRLMGQSEDAIDRLMAAEPSRTRQYKAAGNSIVVDVLVDIFRGIYIDKTFGKIEKRPSLEDYT